MKSGLVYVLKDCFDVILVYIRYCKNTKLSFSGMFSKKIFRDSACKITKKNKIETNNGYINVYCHISEPMININQPSQHCKTNANDVDT